MRGSRRIRRMGRSRKKALNLPLTSLMDVFTILVFFLLFHSSGSEVLEAPKQITLPDYYPMSLYALSVSRRTFFERRLEQGGFPI